MYTDSLHKFTLFFSKAIAWWIRLLCKYDNNVEDEKISFRSELTSQGAAHSNAECRLADTEALCRIVTVVWKFKYKVEQKCLQGKCSFYCILSVPAIIVQIHFPSIPKTKFILYFNNCVKTISKILCIKN